jgi:ParE toxin of type II toxin-antitoxin system, parDE
VSLLVRATPEAETQIREIDSWCRENRLAAPDLFLSELTESFDLVAGAPQIGRLYGSISGAGDGAAGER